LTVCKRTQCRWHCGKNGKARRTHVQELQAIKDFNYESPARRTPNVVRNNRETVRNKFEEMLDGDKRRHY
jgi:hypothetical protein